MFGYKRSSYSGRKGYHYSKGGKNYSRRGTVGRAAAGAAAARKSTKTETLATTVSGVCTWVINQRQNLSNVIIFAPFQGGLDATTQLPNDAQNIVLGGCVNDRQFRMKCACYDEFKLDTMKVSIIPATLAVAGQTTMSLNTMWDRKANPKECGYYTVEDDSWMSSGRRPTALEIYNNEGCIKTQLTSTQLYATKRYCKASSILEKSEYNDATVLYNTTAAESPKKIMYMDCWLKKPMAFSPSLNTCLYSPGMSDAIQMLSASYKVEYTFTFRNPKSEMDTFLTLEAPGYENPVADAEGRQVISKTNRNMQFNALAKTLGIEPSVLAGLMYKNKTEDDSIMSDTIPRRDWLASTKEMEEEDTLKMEEEPKMETKEETTTEATAAATTTIFEKSGTTEETPKTMSVEEMLFGKK